MRNPNKKILMMSKMLMPFQQRSGAYSHPLIVAKRINSRMMILIIKVRTTGDLSKILWK